ncbi:hypothetical protein H0H92_012644, partial [Tricholoma furcatifolium]
MPPIRDTNTTRPLDYAIVEFKGEWKRNPQPHAMDDVRQRLDAMMPKTFTVDWNIAPGYDKKRLIWFKDEEGFGAGETKVGVSVLREALERSLRDRHVEYQACSSTGQMVRFHLLKEEDITALIENPPVFRQRKYHPNRPKFIQPLYALEIGFVGVTYIRDPFSLIGGYIEKKFSHLSAASDPREKRAVRRQRLEFNDSVYCVVVENEAIAEAVLQDPFPIFESCNPKPSPPRYLYVLNQHGYPTEWQRSADQRMEEQRWDNFDRQSNMCAVALDHLVRKVSSIDDRQQHHEERTARALDAMMRSNTIVQEMSAVRADLRELKKDRKEVERLLRESSGLDPKLFVTDLP